MTQPNLFLIVIAGGSGTRFWPKSTSKRPKQLLAFGSSSQGIPASQGTLLAQTLARFDGWVPAGQKMILTTQSLEKAVLEEKLNAKILAEPQGRNTAPCIYWAARHVAEQDPSGVMMVMPSDHYMALPEKFTSVVKQAAQWAFEKDDLVTLGIQPSRPETGYGYLKMGKSLNDSSNDLTVRQIDAFVEKPNLEKANQFVQSGDYLWNGGMFLWRAEVILKAFDRFMPEMKEIWDRSEGRIDVAYPQMTATSIDYGIMEKAKNVVTFPLECGWDDLGSWTSLENLAETLGAQRGQNVITNGELLAIESARNIVDAPSRLVALLGVNDLIVVEQGDAILVAHKDRAQDIRKIVEEVKKTRPELV
jgi:mannose-1-phosphate guanylyltransferase